MQGEIIGVWAGRDPQRCALAVVKNKRWMMRLPDETVRFFGELREVIREAEAEGLTLLFGQWR